VAEATDIERRRQLRFQTRQFAASSAESTGICDAIATGPAQLR
jgi:hypothetical protein